MYIGGAEGDGGERGHGRQRQHRVPGVPPPHGQDTQRLPQPGGPQEHLHRSLFLLSFPHLLCLLLLNCFCTENPENH